MNAAPLRIGVSVPPTGFDNHANAEAYLAKAAGLGLDHIFTADHVAFLDGRGRDGLITVSWLAGLHPTISVYVGVYLLALRHPVVVARQLSTLAEQAPGRLTFGIGVGGEDRHEMEVVGIDPATRGQRTDEALEILKSLLKGRRIDHYGEFYDAPDVVIRPSPEPPIPIVVGGRSDSAIRRAGRHGEGWLAAWCSTERFAKGVALAKLAAAEADRDDVLWRHGYQVWVGFGDTPTEGGKRLSPAMERFYGLPFTAFERYSPVGTPNEVADWLRPFVDAGVSDLNLAPIAGSPDEALEALGEVRRLLQP